ncbi:MAG: hypothetical protein KKC79_10930 [Gammaproteobacteria bacterium]|nr:hypothetical protein [Gammaproteobacteria bacterium]
MTQPTAGQAKDSRVALFCAAQLREAAHTRIVQSFGKFAQGLGPGPSDDDLKLFAKLVAQERRLKAEGPTTTQQSIPSQRQPAEPATTTWKAGASAAYAYGGLADLARMSFGSTRPQALVCDSCSTINRPSALLCKGCSRKLPAFYANEANESKQPSAPPLQPQAKRMRVAASALLSVGLLVLTLVGTGIGHYSSAPSTRVASASQAGTPSLSPPTSPREISGAQASTAPRVTEIAPPVLAPPETTTYAMSADARAMTVSSTEPRIDGGTAAANPEQLSSARQLLSAPKAPTRSAAPRTSDRSIRSALAECDGLNFLSNAICMNNKCADRKIGRSAQCVEP